MNEQEAIERGERIRQASPGTHVDIHWVKPAGTSEAVYTLWIWKKMLDRATALTSIEDVEQWIAKQKG